MRTAGGSIFRPRIFLSRRAPAVCRSLARGREFFCRQSVTGMPSGCRLLDAPHSFQTHDWKENPSEIHFNTL